MGRATLLRWVKRSLTAPALALALATGSAGFASAATTEGELPPLAETSYASAISYRSALLFGQVDPRGSSTRVWFQIGRTRSYGHRVPTFIEEEFNGEEFYEYEEFAECLQPRTRYHYRLVAKSRAGTAYGADKTFRTRARHEKPGHSC